jgi:hypothetical protein
MANRLLLKLTLKLFSDFLQGVSFLVAQDTYFEIYILLFSCMSSCLFEDMELKSAWEQSGIV